MKYQPFLKISGCIRSAIMAMALTTVVFSCQKTTDKVESTEATTKILFPLKDIAGHTEAEVTKQLGKGKFILNWKDKKADCTKCPKYTYKRDSIEVIFINGKADRITLNNLSNYDFDESFITLLGLPAVKPDFSNETVMRWYNYENFREIMAFEDGKAGIHYALIKTKRRMIFELELSHAQGFNRA